MKTATLPSLRVDPALRRAAETVLHEGETLSSFVEQSVRAEVEHRKAQAEFIARGLASRDRGQRTGEYVSASKVLKRLETRLKAAKARHA